MSVWQVWIDTGGTFTDCLALSPEGEVRRAKVLSHGALRGLVVERLGDHQLRVREEWGAPAGFVQGFSFHLLGEDQTLGRVRRYDPAKKLIEIDGSLPQRVGAGAAFEVRCQDQAPVLVARLATGTPAGQALPPLAMRLGTTRGTNALLERRGVRVALFITRGFGDLLRIGTQQRPELFALNLEKPQPLYEEVVEVEERRAADGSLLRRLECQALEEEARRLLEKGVQDAAVALMHSYGDAAHEHQLAAFLRGCGFAHVVCSADLAPFIKLVPRAQTAVVEAYLGPVVGQYLEQVQKALGGGTLHVMTSAGGLLRPSSFRAKDSLLSGPAGGVAGAALVGRRAGCDKVISFDMGGTSTDVARFDGDFEYAFEHQVGQAHLVAPALAIETVAAGGGSVCSVAGGRLRVGPESAGAQPGPACYGAGGPLTLTDVNLLLGRLDASRFGIPIVAPRAQERLEEVRRALCQQTGEEVVPEKLLEGLAEIADERMADAIRRISLRKGYDPAEYALVAFGGAGAQHACGVAMRLGMERVVVPPDAGLLSALGIGHACIERFAERQVLGRLEEARGEVELWLDELARQARQAVVQEGVPEEEIQIRRRLVNLRFLGQDAALTVEYGPGEDLDRLFALRYREVYGHWPENRPVELESLRVVASARPRAEEGAAGQRSPGAALPTGQQRLWLRTGWRAVPAYDRQELLPGMHLEGPALVFEAHSATFVEEGWDLEVDNRGALVLGHRKKPRARRLGQTSQAVRLELFTNRLRAVASEMGTLLQRTALSTNVKERLDFSCGVLDREGELVVNAPHIPVHLGALGLCVRQVGRVLELGPGDTAITNHPAYGGSHLPDITLITAVFSDGGEQVGYVASRAHHAEIGGTRPGSMPPDASCLEQEGVVIAPARLAQGGQVNWERVRRMFQEARYPSRALEDNVADLAAALAANRQGALALGALARALGTEAVEHYMAALKRQAETGVRRALARLPDGVYAAREELDDGTPLQVRLEIRGEQARLDFSGSGRVHPGNLNAAPAVVRSAVMYVLRLLVDEPLPLNEGFMRPVEVFIPEGSLLNPPFPADPARAPAVVGGNVETSQRLVDTLLKALGLAACSQGTMNNLLFGTQDFGYYETIGGGSGAGPGFAGADAVHSHMTNTRITDPEILEHRYPVRLERFAIRRGSGGRGKHRGGNGAVRELVFLEEMDLSVLTQHRREGPYGLAGGEPGKPGEQWLIRASGERLRLAAIDGCRVRPGDRLVLETPGGGGYGKAE